MLKGNLNIPNIIELKETKSSLRKNTYKLNYAEEFYNTDKPAPVVTFMLKRLCFTANSTIFFLNLHETLTKVEKENHSFHKLHLS